MSTIDILETSTFVDVLRWRSLHQPDQRVFTFLPDGENEGDTITYAELDRQARVIGAQLQALGAVGERVLLLYPSGLHYIAAFFGCLYAGAIAVPAHPPASSRSSQRIEAIVADAQIKLVLTNTQIASTLKRWSTNVSGLKTLSWIATDDCLEEDESSWQMPHLTADMLAFLQYTSGSTGLPKGVMVSHGNLIHNSKMLCQHLGHSSNSVGISWLPMFHDMGLIAGVLQPIYVGFPAVLMPPASFIQRPLRWLQAISNYKGTTTWAPNFAYDLCTRRVTAEERSKLSLSSWRVAGNGAEPIRANVIDQFIDLFSPCGFLRNAINPGYGLAEGTLMVSSSVVGMEPTIQHFDHNQLQLHRVAPCSADEKQAQSLVGCGSVTTDQRVVIVDPETLTECRADEIGEIWVAGPSVAQGYWNRPVETEQTFRGFIKQDGPLLRTGDLGFYQDQELFIIGRIKDVIIIRGHNYFPQDIESTVEQCHSALRPGCGAAFSIDIDNEEHLVIVQEVHRSYKNVDGICDIIRRSIAEIYEIQAQEILLVQHGSIPKTTSGKIQRHACREAFLAKTLKVIDYNILEIQTLPKNEYEETLNYASLVGVAPEEQQMLISTYLRRLVSRVLSVSYANLSSSIHLSTYGLDSLKAAELSNQIEVDLEVNLSFVHLLEYTLTELSLYISNQFNDTSSLLTLARFRQKNEDRQKTATSIKALQRIEQRVDINKTLNQDSYKREVPLSFVQQRLWFLDQLEPGNPAYTIPLAVHFQGSFHISIFEQCIQEIVSRHDSLRTTFVHLDDQPMQVIRSEAEVLLRVIDLQGLPSEERERRVEQLGTQEARRPFVLAQGPLLRWCLLCLSKQEHVLLLTMHHLISDGWSQQVLLRELTRLYTASLHGEPARLPDLPIQYADYTLWQREWLQGAILERHLAYWREQLAEVPALDLPTDHPRPVVQRFYGTRTTFALPLSLVSSLKALSQQAGVTLFMTLLASFQVLLARYSGQQDIAVGTPVVGRTHSALEDLIGFFANTLVLRTDLSGNPSFQELLARVREVCLRAYAHQEVPFEQIVEAVHPSRDLSRSPLFQVMLVLQSTLESSPQAMQLGDLTIQLFPTESHTSKFDLALSLFETPQGLSGFLEYCTDLFEATTIQRLLGHWHTLLTEIALQPTQGIETFAMLTEGEIRQLLIEWNATSQDYPRNICLHQILEQQVEQTPDAVALVFEQEHYTYEELNTRANQLAHFLRNLGVGSDQCVIVCIERSLKLMVALLAVLKAGGAYVPLDPTFSAERLTRIFEESQPKIVLTQSHILSAISISTTIPIVCLDANEALWQHKSTSNPVCITVAEQIAYVIYTSGSTGRPKGVMVTHRGVCNSLLWIQETYQLAPGDRMLQKTPYTFDASLLELFWPLLVGATIVIARPEGHKDSSYICSLMNTHAVTNAFFVPSLLQAFLKELGSADCRDLRQVLCGGEPLTVNLQERFSLHHPATIINLYGPTETTIQSTSWDCQSLYSGKTIPIGRPIANTQIYVLNPMGRLAPAGVPGEIYIGGTGLARGYLGQPEITAERFVPNPFAGTEPGSRLYRTGDLARTSETGALEFLGRMDGQIKLRGYRIELGEIESVVRMHPAVHEVVVLLQEEAERKFLVAYVVVQDEHHLTAQQVRDFLLERLPDSMIPAHILFLLALPLNANGKVERRMLPLLHQTQLNHNNFFVAPQTRLQEQLAMAWKDLLHLEQVGIHDNFFELGGHSLLVSKLANYIRTAFEIDIPLRRLFEAPTIDASAQMIDQLQIEQMQNKLIEKGDDEDLVQMLAALEELPDDGKHFTPSVEIEG